ncbi:hypothetical protein [Archangium lansingense]|uniref:Uncharacterized protein n=1 Tax=Archangium lansingense TaxID=2995310 RepID=A0ABT4A014_9BACT|nr:hypothetical protein [Archangium lansinium]MCY1074287.1 hypothetical protein [Archangium lansinium]
MHYYWSQDSVNPSRLIPMGPQVDLLAEHNRARLGPRRLAPAPGVTRH